MRCVDISVMIVLNWILEAMMSRCGLGWCSANFPFRKMMKVLYRCGISWRVCVTCCSVKSGRTLLNLSRAVVWSQAVHSWICHVLWCEVRPYARECVTCCSVKSGCTFVKVTCCGMKSGHTLVCLSRSSPFSLQARSVLIWNKAGGVVQGNC